MKTSQSASLRCPHGNLLSCRWCVRRLIESLLQDVIEVVDAAECQWPGSTELKIHLKLAAASLDRQTLTLRADAASEESEIERRLLS